MLDPEQVHDCILELEHDVKRLRRATGFIWGHLICTQIMVLMLVGVVAYMWGRPCG